VYENATSVHKFLNNQFMAPPKQRTVLITLTFRVDPELVDLFHSECQIMNVTRSERFREIFNEYMTDKYFKANTDETNDD